MKLNLSLALLTLLTLGIAVMTDTDSTGEMATAWYGDIVLRKKSPQCIGGRGAWIGLLHRIANEEWLPPTVIE